MGDFLMTIGLRAALRLGGSRVGGRPRVDLAKDPPRHLRGSRFRTWRWQSCSWSGTSPRPEEIDGGQILALSLPFALIGTMGAIVVLELLFARPRARRGLHVPHPFKALRRRAGIIRRGWQVTRIIARNGLAPLVGLRRGEVSTRSPEELARRVRVALEESGGVFIKLGQLLATRPDLLPPAAMAELGRLHASAAPLAEDQVAQVIREETGRGIEEVFSEVDWDPLGSASIAQAHAARLLDGRAVVVKVRRPGLREQVERDLAIARWLARTAERRTTWGSPIPGHLACR